MPTYFKLRPKKVTTPGASPGLLEVTETALPPKTIVYSFSADTYDEKEIYSTEELFRMLNDRQDGLHWIDVKGLGNHRFLEEIARYFNINKLELEDVVSVHQHPKVEEHDEYLFIVCRMIEMNGNDSLSNEQLSIFNFNNVVLTFQENYDDLLDPVRTRLRTGKGNIRISGTIYLTYAIIDTIIDNYYPVLHSLGDHLDDIENRLLKRPVRRMMFEIQEIKRVLLVMKKAIWPEKDKINALLRSSSPLVTEQAKFFLKDVNDHCIQVIDMVESYREISSSLMELYLSNITNRTNEVMKVLTVVSTIFIPLTFIVGIYGMNFAPANPTGTKSFPLNMPELYSPYGYPVTMLVMLFIAVVQIIYFWRKGWLR